MDASAGPGGPSPGPRLLPMADQPAPERADAQRNRRALLEAAAELIDRCSVENVTMDAVAQRAGVGKGTVFRRFGSREGLMAALLDHSEREWQHAVMAGPPPLGPGAAPCARLHAFGESRLRLNLRHSALIRAAGHTGSRSVPAASFAQLHVRHLLTALEVPGDVAYLAVALLAPLEGPIVQQQLREGVPIERLEAGWHDLVDRLVRA
ncbi:TetR/AcrR family transcriptional regulator [Nocardioides sp.]|uniref:TetR/AcrR family transcriptional regulator n=1 Tax=Nocardioides sp. TaxID=35761 RepID=UPI003516E996